jgi:hypothetical protein
MLSQKDSSFRFFKVVKSIIHRSFCFCSQKIIVAYVNCPYSYFNKDINGKDCIFMKTQDSFFGNLIFVSLPVWCSGSIERDREETGEERLGFWDRSLQWRRELESIG